MLWSAGAYTAHMPDENNRWIIPALLGALFAAVVQITSKMALDGKVDPSVLSLIRGIVITGMFIGIISYERVWSGFSIGGWPLVWAIVSGVGAGLSWFFGYWALKLSSVSKSYPIDKLSVAMGVLLAVFILGERPSVTNWIGIVLMITGAIFVTHKG